MVDRSSSKIHVQTTSSQNISAYKSPPAGILHVRDPKTDIAKGICITLVVYGHMARGLIEQRIAPHSVLEADWIIYIFHMPVFFYISGLYTYGSLLKKGYLIYAKSRIWGILFPYFIWSVIFVISKLLSAHFLKLSHTVGTYDIFLIAFKPIGIFWFLYAIFIFQMTAPLISLAPKCFVALALLLDLITSCYNQLPSIITLMGVHFPFFVIGMYVASSRVDALFDNSIKRIIMMALSCFLFYFMSTIDVEVGGQTYVNFETLPYSIFGIVFILSISNLISRSRFGSFFGILGRRSLAIYLLHIFFLPIFQRILVVQSLGSFAFLLISTIGAILASWGTYRAAEAAHVAVLLGLTGKSPFEVRHNSKSLTRKSGYLS